jgi:hypothetical protein
MPAPCSRDGEAGWLGTWFQNIVIDTDLGDIRRAQAKHWNVVKGLALATQHRYAIRAINPT